MKEERKKKEEAAAQEQPQELKIATINIFSGQCNNFNKINEYLDNSDILFTQETGYNQKIKDYEYFDGFGNPTERVGCYIKKNNKSIDKKSVHKKIEIESDLVTPRFGIIYNIQDVKIANLHLAGGRFDDIEVLKNFEEINNFKIKLLNEIINEKPDIILGDFNSVYSIDEKQNQKFLESQYNWFKSLKEGNELTHIDKENINSWNSLPFKTLEENKYVYAKPKNENMYTNGRGQTIIDFIWYNPITIDIVKEAEIKDMLNNKNDNYNNNNCISDHNPVICTISKKKKMQKD